MKNKYFKRKLLLTIFLLTSIIGIAQVGIGTTTPNASSMLDIDVSALDANAKKGILMPRMTTEERDLIAEPAEGLHIYNTTNNSQDVFSDGVWKSLSFSSNANSNLVYVYSIADLPTPAGTAITLDATKMYIFSGFVDISPNYIVINGSGLRGTDPQKDMVVSNVSGAVLRSIDTSIFIENLAVVPFGSNTKAYDFSDSTGTKFCNVFSGSSVVELMPSLGVGQISGFKAITFTKNYWNVTDGIKVTGTVGKFAVAYCFVESISNGSAIEFLSALTIDDIDLSNNYFIYSGQTGIKLNAGATVDRGRLTTNMFRGVTTPLEGVDSYAQGWSMKQNTNIPDSRAFSFIYFNNNVTATALTTPGTFYKIAGATIVVNQKRFVATNNRITYNDVEPIVGEIFVTIGAKAPANGSDFSIGIAKNGTIISAPIASMAAATNNQSFQIILNTEVDLVLGDYIEIFMTSNNSNASSIVVNELQFRVTD